MKREITECRMPGEKAGTRNANGKMSEELWQNARQTIGELRDLMRETGITWEFISREIERASHKPTGVERAMERMDPYSTGPGKSLNGLPRNIEFL